MDYTLWMNYVSNHMTSIGVQCVLTFLTFLLVRYRYKASSDYLTLSHSIKEKLIRTFQPLPIVENVEKPYRFGKLKCNFSSFDVFNFSNIFKSEIKGTISEYGVGTCGPRGFYGTLDLHLELEKKISSLFNMDGAIVYSNYFLCVQSVMSCFCTSRNHIFIHKDSSEAIQRGAQHSRANIIIFDDIEDLRNKLKSTITDKFVVVERLGKNNGKLMDLKTLIDLKYEFGFRIILDEAYSIPFIYQRPDGDLYKDIDIIVGALCLGYPTNGGYSVGCNPVIEYQRLSGSSYVFSASLPAFLAKAVMCMLESTIDYTKVREKIKLAFKYIDNIKSYENSPILLIECENVKEKKKILNEDGYVVGIHGNYLRLCINEDCNVQDLERVGELLRQ